jgi:hypothetical protein
MQADLAAFEISFSPQAWHSLRPPSLYSPSLQATHSVLVPSLQGDSCPSPTAHDEHGMQADLATFEISFSPQAWHLLRPPSLYSPSPQATHSVSVPSLQGDSCPSPTAQDEHGIQADLAAFEITFSPQAWHSLRPPSLYSPSLQATHSVSVPSLQGKTHPSPTAQDEHGTQADLASFEISFSPQAWHASSPPSLYSPSLQGNCATAMLSVGLPSASTE